MATLAVFSLLLVGCSGGKPAAETGTVSGQVTHHGGKPLTDAEISFIAPQLGSQASALLGPDGKYEITRPLKAGNYQVQVAPPVVISTPPAPPPKPKANPDLPKKAQSYATSGLTATIKAGKNEFNFDLKD